MTKLKKNKSRKTSPNRCPHCGKSLPFTLPPYMRVKKGEDGVWRPIEYGICKCNKEQYEFCVLDLAEKKNREEKQKGREEE